MTPERFDELFDAYLDGTLSAADAGELTAALREPRWQAAAREAAHFQGALAENFKAARQSQALQLQLDAQSHSAWLPRKTWAIAALVLLAITLFAVLRTQSGAEAHSVVAARADTAATVILSDGSTQPLSPNMVLPRECRIQTGKGAASSAAQVSLKLWDKATVQLAAETTLDIRGADGDARVLELTAGQVRIDSSELTKAGRHLVVKTKYADIRTAGTRFNVLLESDQVRLFVEEGRVALSNAQGTQTVAANQESTARLAAAPTEPVQRTLAILKNTFKSDQGRMISVAFSPDGRMLATGDSVRQVKMWDLESGAEIPVKMGQPEPVKCVAFAPKHRRIAGCDGHGNVRLWDADSGEELRTVSRNTGVICVSFSPDGKTLAAGELTGLVTLWDLETGKARVLDRHSDTVVALAFSPDGTLLAAGHESRSARVWDVQTGAVLQTFNNLSNAVAAVTFSPDNTLLAIGVGDPVSKLWSYTTVAPQYKEPRAQPAELITLWNVNSGAKVAGFSGTEHGIVSLLFLPDGETLISGSADARLTFRDVATQAELSSTAPHTALIRSLALAPDGQTLATASHDGSVRLWTLRKR